MKKYIFSVLAVCSVGMLTLQASTLQEFQKEEIENAQLRAENYANAETELQETLKQYTESLENISHLESLDGEKLKILQQISSAYDAAKENALRGLDLLVKTYDEKFDQKVLTVHQYNVYVKGATWASDFHIERLDSLRKQSEMALETECENRKFYLEQAIFLEQQQQKEASEQKNREVFCYQIMQEEDNCNEQEKAELEQQQIVLKKFQEELTKKRLEKVQALSDIVKLSCIYINEKKLIFDKFQAEKKAVQDKIINCKKAHNTRCEQILEHKDLEFTSERKSLYEKLQEKQKQRVEILEAAVKLLQEIQETYLAEINKEEDAQSKACVQRYTNQLAAESTRIKKEREEKDKKEMVESTRKRLEREESEKIELDNYKTQKKQRSQEMKMAEEQAELAAARLKKEFLSFNPEKKASLSAHLYAFRQYYDRYTSSKSNADNFSDRFLCNQDQAYVDFFKSLAVLDYEKPHILTLEIDASLVSQFFASYFDALKQFKNEDFINITELDHSQFLQQLGFTHAVVDPNKPITNNNDENTAETPTEPASTTRSSSIAIKIFAIGLPAVAATGVIAYLVLNNKNKQSAQMHDA